MYTLRPVEIDFIATAPLRLVFATTLSASPNEVFDALAFDPEGMPGWCPAVSRAQYVEPGPFVVGSHRRLRLVGGVRFHETVLAADSPSRFAYRIDQTTAPGLSAMAEDWSIRGADEGTRVVWTVAVDARLPMRLGLKAMRPVVAVGAKRALAGLDRQLAGFRRGL